MASRNITGLDGSLPTAEHTSRTEPAFGAIITARATKVLAARRLPSMFRALPAVLGAERVAALAAQARIRFHPAA